MAKRGWIKGPERGADPHSELCRFFGVNSLEGIANIGHAAKKSDEGALTGEQVVWLYRVRQIAQEMIPPPYDPAKLRDATDAFAELRKTRKAFVSAPLLDQAGVRSCSEALPGSKSDGFLMVDPIRRSAGFREFDRSTTFGLLGMHATSPHGHGKPQRS